MSDIPQDENKLIAERRAKLAQLRVQGAPAFPNDFRRDVLAEQLHARYGSVDDATLDAVRGDRPLAEVRSAAAPISTRATSPRRTATWKRARPPAAPTRFSTMILTPDVSLIFSAV